MRSHVVVGVAAAAAVALGLWSCGGGTTAPSPSNGGSTPPPASTPSAVTINIVGSAGNQAFKPNPVAAAVGATVMFKNDDTTTHHIVMDDGSADLGEVAPGSTSRTTTVRTSSATNFHCTLHSSMVGSLNAQTAPTPPPCTDPYGYGCD